MARGLHIRHPDVPGLRAGTGPAGSGLRGHTCVLNMSGSVRVVCGALPALPGETGWLRGILCPAPKLSAPRLEPHIWPPSSVRPAGHRGDVCVMVGVPAPPAAATPALRRPPGVRWLPSRSTGTLSSRGRAVGSLAKLWLEWHSRRSWRGAWHRNPTCFVSVISWRAGHVAVWEARVLAPSLSPHHSHSGYDRPCPGIRRMKAFPWQPGLRCPSCPSLH